MHMRGIIPLRITAWHFVMRRGIGRLSSLPFLVEEELLPPFSSVASSVLLLLTLTIVHPSCLSIKGETSPLNGPLSDQWQF